LGGRVFMESDNLVRKKGTLNNEHRA
jgi:hypothetical protein